MSRSLVNRNVADGGGYSGFPAGGAIYLQHSSEGEIVDCELLENIARGGDYANAGTILSHRPCDPWPLHYTRCASVRPFDPRCRRSVCYVVETEADPFVGQPEPS
jgi:hypothetical protein